jgi:hypothetical protein
LTADRFGNSDPVFFVCEKNAVELLRQLKNPSFYASVKTSSFSRS